MLERYSSVRLVASILRRCCALWTGNILSVFAAHVTLRAVVTDEERVHARGTGDTVGTVGNSTADVRRGLPHHLGEVTGLDVGWVGVGQAIAARRFVSTFFSVPLARDILGWIFRGRATNASKILAVAFESANILASGKIVCKAALVCDHLGGLGETIVPLNVWNRVIGTVDVVGIDNILLELVAATVARGRRSWSR